MSMCGATEGEVSSTVGKLDAEPARASATAGAENERSLSPLAARVATEHAGGYREGDARTFGKEKRPEGPA